MKKLLIILTIVFGTTLAYGQEKAPEAAKPKHDKFRWGFTFMNVWSDVQGSTPDLYTKPSLGGIVKVEYYPVEFLGITAGVGYQQRGYGLILPDTGFVAPSLNTYRNRIRTNNLEFPIGLILKTPKPIAGGSTWLTANVGISPLRMFEANDVYLSVEDGFHIVNDVTTSFNRSDSPVFVSFGPEIDTSAGYLQIHLIGSFGSKELFTDVNNPKGYSGKNRFIGLSIGCTF
jgi:hypothetical protein